MAFNPKTILTEDGWDAVAPPGCKGKDKELRAALMFYWSLEDDDFDFRCKALGKITALAAKFKTAKEVTGDKDKKTADLAVKHLTDVVTAAKAKQAELVKAKGEAEKAATKVEALTKKQADEAAKQQAAEEKGDEAGDGEDEEQEANSLVKLTKLLKSLRTSKTAFHFLVCDVKPYGLVLCKKPINNSATHKKELAKLAGGSTRPPKFGTCRVESGKLIFEMDKPPSGLAGILQKWIKNTTKEKFTKVMVGTESADDEEGPSEGEPAAVAEAEETELPQLSPALLKAPEAWRATQRSITKTIKQLQAAVRKSLAGESPALVKEVQKNVTALDGVAEMLGDELPEFLGRAIIAKDAATRTAQLGEAQTLLASYLELTKGQGAELIAHIDSNPFGVKTNLKKTLTDALTEMAEAIENPA